MTFSKFKPTPKGGAKKAAEIFKSTRKKQPSDQLVKIISEVGQTEEVEKPPRRDDRAAKDVGV